jgi:hypothetical protein
MVPSLSLEDRVGAMRELFQEISMGVQSSVMVPVHSKSLLMMRTGTVCRMRGKRLMGWTLKWLRTLRGTRTMTGSVT